jgi:type III secretion protein C
MKNSQNTPTRQVPRSVWGASKWLSAILASMVMSPLFAADMAWTPNKIRYVADKKELQAFLREFAAGQRIAVNIDPKVQGVLNGRYDLSPKTMFELIANTYGLVWYFDGKVLYVNPSTDVRSEILKLTSISVPELERSLERLGISDSRYPIVYDAERGTAMVSGPTRFVDLVLQVAKTIDRAQASDDTTETRTYQLRYSFADDYTVQHGGKEHKVPGIVSILRQLHADRQRGGSLAATKRIGPTLQMPLDRSATTRVKGTDLTVGVPPALPQFSSEEQVPNAPSPSGSSIQPMFAADARTNSVIIKDIPSRVNGYESLIRSLDFRPTVVEIDISIVEVSSNDLESLGVDWRIVSNRIDANVGSGARDSGGASFNNVPSVPSVISSVPLIGAVANLQGGSLMAILGNRDRLIARISALEEKGRASVRAHPIIMTLNNTEAILESNSTFYIPVSGFQDAQLFDVSVGTSIRITPSVVTEQDNKSRLRMLIKIEDGAVTDQRVSQLPVVQRSTIGTQAVINDGSTLVIAGYTQERETETRWGIPFLSSLPIVGAAFSSNDKRRSRVERLFMITPRVVELSNDDMKAK